MASYYKKINGKNYDKKLLDLADKFTSAKGDGRISQDDAKILLDAVKDNNQYSDVEKKTMEYIRDKYKFTKSADEFFRTEIRKWAGSKNSSKKTSNPKKPSAKTTEQTTTSKKISEPIIENNKQETIGKISEDPNIEKVKPFPWWIILILALLFILFLLFKFGFITSKSALNQQVPEAPKKEIPKVENPKKEESKLTKEDIQKLNFTYKKKSSELTEDTKKTLEQIANFLKENQNLKLKILGHSCDLGGEELNRKVSQNRADKIKSFLVQKGIKKERLVSIGRGESEPLVPNDTEEGKNKNRRVQFQLE